MKVIINEEQLRLIIESNDVKLLDLTNYVSMVTPDLWDKVFLGLRMKSGNDYDGYYIEGDVDLREYKEIELDYLVEVRFGKKRDGNLICNYNSKVSLKRLSKVDGNLDLGVCVINELPKLEYVGGVLALQATNISNLDNLHFVGRNMFLANTPLGDKLNDSGMSKYEMKNKYGVKGDLYI
jgi:hypothetical protein